MYMGPFRGVNYSAFSMLVKPSLLFPSPISDPAGVVGCFIQYLMETEVGIRASWLRLRLDKTELMLGEWEE